MNSKNAYNEAGFNKLSLVRQFDEVQRAYTTLLEASCEKEFLQFAHCFEDCRIKWDLAENRCLELQEKLTKSEAEKNALLIKLKHARRQIEVELQGRQKAEQDRDELDQQIMLVRELLLSDGSSTATLSEEQQRKLDFLNASRYQSPRCMRNHRRLDPIDETGSMLSDYSDISFDVTEDDLDGSNLRNGKQWKRGRAARRAFAGDEDAVLPKRVRADAGESLQCTVDGPATMRIEKLEKSFSKPNPHQGRRRPSREHRRRSAATSDSETQSSEVENFWPNLPLPKSPAKPVGKKHTLQLKPCVITKETCKPCGKRIQFGKKALKCSNCHLVAHSECEEQSKSHPCDSSSPSAANQKCTVEDFLVSTESPQIPPIIYHTIQEIERRGLDEIGLYRIPGMLRIVKELREKFKGKNVPKLTDVSDIHALCSLVKDFLRVTLKEPIVTFSLRPRFIKAAKQTEDDMMYDVLRELDSANRDTLMFLVLHFQRVVANPTTRMSVEGLSKAVGPSVVGFSSPDPSVSALQNSAHDQEIVLTKLLKLPADYYVSQLQKATSSNRPQAPGTPDAYKAPESYLGSLSPRKTPSSSSIAERARKYLGGTPFGRSKRGKESSYFASPSLN